jgi:tRNA uridine 5-carboxymethylaminomethyl modification enzyme
LEIERHSYYEHLELPKLLDYLDISGLSNEVRQKLIANKPQTLGQAARISGVTPAAISILLIYLKKGASKKSAPV